MNIKQEKYIAGIALLLVILTIISLAVMFFAHIGFLEASRIVFGSVYVLFIPGFVISYIFFPKNNKSIDWIERIALSFALSIAIVPLVVFYLNLIGIKISFISSFLTILGIILVSFGILLWRNK